MVPRTWTHFGDYQNIQDNYHIITFEGQECLTDAISCQSMDPTDPPVSPFAFPAVPCGQDVVGDVAEDYEERGIENFMEELQVGVDDGEILLVVSSVVFIPRSSKLFFPTRLPFFIYGDVVEI